MKKNKTSVLAAALAVLALSWASVNITRSMHTASDYTEKVEAAQMTQACLEEVRRLKEERGIPISAVNDINDTGMIGQDYSCLLYTS